MDDTTAPTERAPGWARLPEVWTAAGLTVFATIAGLVGGWHWHWLATLVRDPADQIGFPVYVGLLSHIGVMAMTSATAITLFAALVVGPGGVGRTVLLSVGLLSGVLVIDDMFMIHELMPRLGEVAIYAFFGLCALMIWRGIRALPGEWDMRGLKLAIGLMGLSVVTDIFKVYGPFAYWLEDFSKLAGFGAWLAFWAGFGREAIRRS